MSKSIVIRCGLVLLLALSGLAGCATQRTAPPTVSSGTPTIDPTVVPPGYSRSYVVFGKTYYILSSAEGFVEEGLASWYGPKFHGRKTANGETYNMHGVTAAHKNLPLGTWVRVTNLDNRKSLDLRINDRGPFVEDRVIDLSLGAAKVLDVVGPGTAPVRVEALSSAVARTGTPDPGVTTPEQPVVTATIDRPSIIVSRPAPAVVAPPAPTRPAEPVPSPELPASGSATDFKENGFIQIASFGDKTNAERMVKQLEQSGFDNVIIQAMNVGERLTHRVRLGPLLSPNQQQDLLNRLTTMGLRGFRVVPN